MSAPRPLTPAERAAVTGVAAATALLGTVGFLNSFARVRTAAVPSFGWFAWTVPLGIDLGIAVFSALDIVLSRLEVRPRWLRLIPWSLTAATVYLNVAGEATVFGRVAHAVLPGLWVIAVEVGAHTIRVRAGLASPTRMDRIRRSRWLLAPRATVALWRRMVLWEIRSYPDALTRERARLLALTDLQDTYGRWAWRWKAPRRARALYRLGEHPTGDPASAPDTTSQAPTTTADTAPVSAPDAPANRARRRPRKPRTGTRGTGGRVLYGDYLAAARDALTPGTTVTPLWVRQHTGCSRGTATRVAAELTSTAQQSDDGQRAA